MASETKTKDKIEQSTDKPAQGNNKVLFWILGGCLALILIGGLITAGLAWWGYKKVKNEIKTQQSRIEEQKNQMTSVKPDAVTMPENVNENFQEEPATGQPSSAEGTTPFPTEKQIGYIKKVYAKSGKNYLDVDYIQWLTGSAAEKAMREDNQCPKAGECIVLNDYYIRNQNPLVRTFEISPDVKVVMQTYGAEQTGIVNNSQEISLDQLKGIFSSGAESHLKDVPYIVEISNQQIVKITEQYIP
jgi:hypothetical protein